MANGTEAAERSDGNDATTDRAEHEDRVTGRFAQGAVMSALKNAGAIGIGHVSRQDRGEETAYAIRCTYKVGTFHLIKPKLFPHLVIDARMRIHEDLIPAVNALRGEKRGAELTDMVLDGIANSCDVDFSSTVADDPTLRYQLVLVEDDERKLGRALRESMDIMVRAILSVHYKMAARLGVRLKTAWA